MANAAESTNTRPVFTDIISVSISLGIMVVKSDWDILKPMRTALVLGLAMTAGMYAQVRFNPNTGDITIDGKPFTTFHPGTDAGKPYLAPILSPSGKYITRRFPMEDIPGESKDHLHHRGLWFSCDEVNKVMFWTNELSYNRKDMGRISVRESKWKDGNKAGTLNAIMDWKGPDGHIMMVENRAMTFSGDSIRTLGFEITLTAQEDITFGDTHESFFAIRLADKFKEVQGGKSVNAEGLVNMQQIWGKRSPWVDYTADLEGELLGVSIFDHPDNPRHPAHWHARDYGLVAASPFGAQKAFDTDENESPYMLPKGKSVTLRFRVIIHPGDAVSGHVAELYKEYAKTK